MTLITTANISVQSSKLIISTKLRHALNSLAILLLYLQNCHPPILPPLNQIFPGIISDTYSGIIIITFMKTEMLIFKII